MTRAETVIARCRQLALLTDVPGTTTRLFLSPATHEAHALLRGWMEAAGLAVTVDALGSLRGLYAGEEPDASRLLLGSHVDTVPDAGAFDGVLGVLLGLALIEQLHGERLPFAIELIAFSEEEGVRFSKPFLGSLAVTGQLDAAALARQNAAGVTIAQAVRNFGLDPSALAEAALHSATFAFVEFHIEQGPVLQSLGRPLGVVEAIAGQSRYGLRFSGQANHAGTTPMALRRDALAAAAAWMVEVERLARATPGLVATVGQVSVKPGAINIVPGETAVTLDLRHANDAVRTEAVRALLQMAGRQAEDRGVACEITLLHEQAAMAMDASLITSLLEAAARAGLACDTMTSGAGHDAMILAPYVPTAMLFLRSPSGISHHPDETVLVDDVEAALATGMELLAGLRYRR